MDKVVTCTCPDCKVGFILEARDLRDVRELRCPICDEVFDPPDLDDDDDD
jgi:rubredoxin